jgi:hypothetical protein
VTTHRPKLRGALAVEAGEERRQRLREGVGGASAAAIDEPSLRAARPRGTPPLLLDVRASVLPAEALAAAGVELSTFYVPRSLEPPSGTEAPLPPSPAAGTLRPAVARGAVEDVLSDLVRDVLASTDVRRELERAPMPQTPFFAQIRTSAPPAPPPAPAAAVDQDDLTEEELEALGAAQARADSEARELARREESKRADARRAEVFGSAELQELAAYTLEATLFNLVCDAAHGEFSLDTAPRQIVTSLDITKAGR